MINNFNMIKFSHCGRKTSVGVIQKKFYMLRIRAVHGLGSRMTSLRIDRFMCYVIKISLSQTLWLPSPPVGLPFLVSVNFGKLICVCGH